ncbi:hypothetical protein LOK49_LG07G00201 [Camellia lanceoleosa]|uniref:Uncharacterized protein n=1 Tax=Camellia lanceoleosa TaxID=1840588 RepID=A0ACC0H4V9_9ERIC|nr:hypothetical protein LOK49_LG07G00201 [Camellia lanceoleosa]
MLQVSLSVKPKSDVETRLDKHSGARRITRQTSFLLLKALITGTATTEISSIAGVNMFFLICLPNPSPVVQTPPPQSIKEPVQPPPVSLSSLSLLNFDSFPLKDYDKLWRIVSASVKGFTETRPTSGLDLRPTSSRHRCWCCRQESRTRRRVKSTNWKTPSPPYL